MTSLENDKEIISQRYFEAINKNNIELIHQIKDHFDEIKSIYPIIMFIIERLSAVTDLAMQNRIWDAEIIYRSALEAFIKLLFITSADEEERGKRTHEFWVDLKEINSLKQSEQAKVNLKEFGNYEIAKIAYSPLIMAEEEEKQLRNKWPRRLRNQIEQKWSFSEIIKFLSQNYRGRAMTELAGLLHSYRMASHVSHGDETGILIIEERSQRSVHDQEVANFAHFLRLLSDAFQHCTWTSFEVVSLYKGDLSPFIKIRESVNDLNELIDQYHMKLYDDPSYDKFR